MATRIDRLITRVRQRTDNEDFSDTAGINDEAFLAFFNEAQARLQSRILAENPSTRIFDTTGTIAVVNGTREYNLPAGAYLGVAVRLLEYRSSSSDKYYEVDRRQLREFTDSSGRPLWYTTIGTQLAIYPTPDRTGTFRITYPEKLDDLDKRRGTITSTTATTIVLDNDSVLDSTNLALAEYICTVDKNGVVQDYRVEVTSYDSGTRTLTIPSATLTATTGDYVVIGERASTHSSLFPEGERYLLAYVAWKVLKMDSSLDSQEQETELRVIEEDIITKLDDITHDVEAIPVINEFWS